MNLYFEFLVYFVSISRKEKIIIYFPRITYWDDVFNYFLLFLSGEAVFSFQKRKESLVCFTDFKNSRMDDKLKYTPSSAKGALYPSPLQSRSQAPYSTIKMVTLLKGHSESMYNQNYQFLSSSFSYLFFFRFLLDFRHPAPICIV